MRDFTGYIDQKNRKIFAICMLAIFSCIILNNILFIHSHVLADGQIVIHAHPFVTNEEGYPKAHKHTSNEYISLAKIFFGESPVQEIFTGIALQPFVLYSLTEKNNFKSEIQRDISSSYRRGPPIV